MNAQKFLDEILQILYTVKENKDKLQKILYFLEEEIYEEPEKIELPAKYKEVVSQIADSIDAGYVCFFNTDTIETEEIPKNMIDDAEEFELMTGESFENMEIKHTAWENYITIEPLYSNESFDIMLKFVDSLEDEKMKFKLENALNNRKPFANFKNIIENSVYRNDWFDFKKEFLENYVSEKIFMYISVKEDDIVYNGFYNDDGTKINTEKVDIPGMCITCKSFYTEDKEENMMCIMNRYDQRKENNFKCGAYKEI